MNSIGGRFIDKNFDYISSFFYISYSTIMFLDGSIANMHDGSLLSLQLLHFLPKVGSNCLLG
jgi:hypothetical protein